MWSNWFSFFNACTVQCLGESLVTIKDVGDILIAGIDDVFVFLIKHATYRFELGTLCYGSSNLCIYGLKIVENFFCALIMKTKTACSISSCSLTLCVSASQ